MNEWIYVNSKTWIKGYSVTSGPKMTKAIYPQETVNPYLPPKSHWYCLLTPGQKAQWEEDDLAFHGWPPIQLLTKLDFA